MLYWNYTERAGEVQVKIRSGGGRVYLMVKDNGIGLPVDVNPQKTGTIGLTLVKTLVRQLKGSMEIDGSQGTEFRIAFSIN